MKKIISVLIVSIVVSLVLTSPLFAQTNTELQQEDNLIQNNTVVYDLPYPGILPDNPLYMLKILRDKLIPILITSPDKKIQFYLLQADKGILSSSILIEKGNYSLADKTLLKAENYMTEITFQLFSLTEKPSKDFLGKLKLASLKHQEIIEMNLSRIPEDKRSTFTTVLEFSERNLTRIKEYEQQSIK
jgi:hypothetical protein